jgi:hypothetical protein
MLNFDQMKDMSHEELLAYKEQLIELYISSLPEDRQRPLRQLQWTIDGELRKYKDPIAKMNKMAELFWNQFSEFQKAVKNLQDTTENITR